MDAYAQYLKYKKKYQHIKSVQKGGDIMRDQELKMNKEIQQVNAQYSAYNTGQSGYSTEIDAAKNYEIEQIKNRYSSINKPLSVSHNINSTGSRPSAPNMPNMHNTLNMHNIPTTPTTPTTPISRPALNKSAALQEIQALINKVVNLDSPSQSPQDAYDKGFVSAQLSYLTGSNTVPFENDPKWNSHYVAGFDDGETAAEVKERGSNKYVHIYRDDYVIPNEPMTPQSAIVSQSPPKVLPRAATDKIKAIESKYTGKNGSLGTYGPGTDALLNQMDAEISQVIKEYTSK
jgi:hypothetical protein